MNTCDHGHQTAGSVRKLPTGGNGNVYVCRRHYDKEMTFRRETGWEDIDGFVAFPEWQDLHEQEGEAHDMA